MNNNLASVVHYRLTINRLTYISQIAQAKVITFKEKPKTTSVSKKPQTDQNIIHLDKLQT